MKLFVLALACLVAIAFAQTVNREVDACTENAFNIDNFVVRAGPTFDRIQATQGETTTTVATHPITGAPRNFVFAADSFPPSVGSPDNIIGGFRDTIVYIDQDRNPPPSAGQGVRININNGTVNGVSTAQLRYSTDQGLKGIGEIQWDGNSDSANPRNFVKTGLGGINLAARADSFTIVLQDTDLPSSFRVEAWSFAGGVEANSRGVFFEWDPSVGGSEQVFTFSLFQPIGAAISPLAVFGDLGALRLFIQDNNPVAPEIDLTIFSLEFTSRFCLFKSVASNPGPATTIDTLFPLFFGANRRILSGACPAGALNVGDRVTYFVQSFSEQSGAGSYTIRDTLASGLQLVAGSVRTFTHGISGVTANVLSSAPGTIAVQVTSTAAVTSTRVTVFYDVIVTAAAVDLEVCQNQVPNRATLDFGGNVPLSSVHFNGTGVEDRATLICVRGTVAFSMTLAASKTEVDTDESFSLTASFRNTGTIGALNTLFTCQILTNNAELLTGGFSLNGGVYSRNIGTVFPSTSDSSATASFRPTDDSDINIRCCITNTANSAPAHCESQVCRELTVEVGALSDLKICKRARLIRRLEYTVDVYNCGDADANDVVIVETIPPGTVFNPDLSDDRWSCANGVCVITLPVLEAGQVICIVFVVDILDDTPVCTEFNNTVIVNVLDEETPDIDLTDNIANWTIIQYGCPLPPPPPAPECCDCPAPPTPPPMCPCPEPDPCDACWEHDHHDDECEDNDHHGGYGKGGKSTTTINFDFSAEDLV